MATSLARTRQERFLGARQQISYRPLIGATLLHPSIDLAEEIHLDILYLFNSSTTPFALIPCSPWPLISRYPIESRLLRGLLAYAGCLLDLSLYLSPLFIFAFGSISEVSLKLSFLSHFHYPCMKQLAASSFSLTGNDSCILFCFHP